MIPAWEQGYATLDEAKSHLPVNDPNNPASRECTITAITGREEGMGLAVNECKGYTTIKNAKVTVTFTATCTVTTINKEVKGWFFYGWGAD